MRSDPEAIRRRLNERLDAKRMKATDLAEMIRVDKRNVQNYVSGDTKTIPADFIAKCEEGGFASARWLLLEEGLPDAAGPDEAALRLAVVGRVAGGEIDPEALRALASRLPDEELGTALETLPPPNGNGSSQEEAS